MKIVTIILADDRCGYQISVCNICVGIDFSGIISLNFSSLAFHEENEYVSILFSKQITMKCFFS